MRAVNKIVEMKIFQALRKEFWPYQKTKAHSHRVQNKGRNRGNEGPPQTMKVEHDWGKKEQGPHGKTTTHIQAEKLPKFFGFIHLGYLVIFMIKPELFNSYQTLIMTIECGSASAWRK